MQESLEKIDFDFTPLLEKARKRTAFHIPIGLELPTKLVISNEIHSGYTVIDLQTADRLGLLYDVLICLSRAKVNIALSRIATEKGAAFDSFYVTDLESRKITDEAHPEASADFVAGRRHRRRVWQKVSSWPHFAFSIQSRDFVFGMRSSRL